jgi:hypothetical protein
MHGLAGDLPLTAIASRVSPAPPIDKDLYTDGQIAHLRGYWAMFLGFDLEVLERAVVALADRGAKPSGPAALDTQLDVGTDFSLTPHLGIFYIFQ